MSRLKENACMIPYFVYSLGHFLAILTFRLEFDFPAKRNLAHAQYRLKYLIIF